jgi:hypothetical protein
MPEPTVDQPAVLVSRNENNPVTGGLTVTWAVETLSQRLAEKGIGATVDPARSAALTIRLATPDEVAGVEVPSGPESFAVVGQGPQLMS